MIEMINIILDIGSTEHYMMDWWFETFGNLAWLVMMAGWVVYFGLGGLFAYLVHKDALKSKMKNPDLWMIVVFLLNIVGVLLYLLAKSNYSRDSAFEEGK